MNNFLHSLPETSFFRKNLLKYGNFSICSIEEQLSGTLDFNEKMSCVLSKHGDLIHKIYLKVILPKIKIQRNIDSYLIEIKKNKLLDIQYKYNTSKSFYELVYLAIRKIKKILLTGYNQDNINIQVQSVISNVADYNFIQNQEIYNLKLSKFDIFKQIQYTQENTINDYLNQVIYYIKQDDKYYLDLINTLKKEIINLSNPFNDIKWVDNIGHHIIKSINIQINGIEISSYDNDFIKIQQSLILNPNITQIYNKMISNYNKNDIYVYIPLIFWFNNNHIQSIPAVFLRNAEIIINFTFNKLENCVVNYVNNVKIKHASFLIDYIYLNTIERNLLCNQSFDHMIEYIQTNTFKFDINKNYILKLDFVKLVKELVFVIKTSNDNDLYSINIIFDIIDITNNENNLVSINIGKHVFSINDSIEILQSNYYNGIYKIVSIFDNFIIINCPYSINDNTGIVKLITIYNNNNPLLNSNLIIGGHNKYNIQSNIYTNIIQQYQYHTNNISNGINVYNFGLYPESFQSSGYFNFSAKCEKNLEIELHDLFYQYCTIKQLPIIIKVYAITYQILRYKNGYVDIII